MDAGLEVVVDVEDDATECGGALAAVARHLRAEGHIARWLERARRRACIDGEEREL